MQRAGHKPSLRIPSLMRRKRIADAINYFYQQDPETAEKMMSQIESYHEKLRAAGLVIDDPIVNRGRPQAILTFCWQTLVLIAWLLPALVGLVMRRARENECAPSTLNSEIRNHRIFNLLLCIIIN